MINFKSIASAELEPRHLTIVAGANSSGKSSLLQSLLFLAQSFGEPAPVINGDLVRLGEPRDVIRDGADDMTFEFSFPELRRSEQGSLEETGRRTLRLTLGPRKESQSLVAETLSLLHDEKPVFLAARSDAPTDLPLVDEEIVLRILEPERHHLPEDSFVTVSGVTPVRLVFRADRDELERAFDNAFHESEGRGRWFFEELARFARSLAPDSADATRLTRLLERRPGAVGPALTPADRQILLQAFQEMEAPAGWVSEAIAVRPSARRYSRTTGEASGRTDPTFLARHLGRALEHVERLAGAVLYLGPLRDDPRVAYPLGHTVRALPVGEKGEFTAAYLRANDRARITYGRRDRTMTTTTLPLAVNHWCDHLGIADRIKVTPQGKLGHQLGLRVAGRERDPTAIGVGASQLLPVVVLVLGAPEGALVLLEQPELHLHPKVQSRLGDFLAYSRPDIRLVIETHSEYLLTRLRLRIAQSTLDQGQIAVLFASQRGAAANADEEDGLHTEFSHLRVDELGDFDYWPEDFFDSLDADSVELARAVADLVRKRKDPSGP